MNEQEIEWPWKPTKLYWVASLAVLMNEHLNVGWPTFPALTFPLEPKARE